MTTKVQWEMSTTINLGNFNSFKIGVQVEDSAKSGENAKELSNRVHAFVDSELTQRTAELRKELEANG